MRGARLRSLPGRLPLVMLAATLCGYAAAVENGFCLDDRGIVLENRLLREGRWGELVTSGYWQGVSAGGGGLYRPVALAVIGAEWALFGEAAGAYHVVSILLQALAASLVVAFAASTGCRRRPAYMAGGLFCLHPAASEVVNAVVGVADLLALIAGLGGLCLLCTPAARRGGWGCLPGGGLLAVAALAKENAVVYAAGAGLVGLLHERRRPHLLATALVAAAAPAALRWGLTGHLGAGGIGFLDNPLAFVELPVRLANAAPLAVRYLMLVAFPWPLFADASYDQIPVLRDLVGLRVLAPLLLVTSLALLAAGPARRHRALAAWAGVTAATLGLACHVIVPIGTIYAERLAYPILGAVGVAAACGLAQLARRRRRTAIALGACWLVVGARLDWQRTRDWHDDGRLFARAVQVAPRSARCHFGLGLWRHETGDVTGALAAYARALAIYPRYTDALFNNGAALLQAGRLREALASYQAAAATRPEHAEAMFAAAAIREALDGSQAGRQAYAQVLATRPTHGGAARALARLCLAAGDTAAAGVALRTAFGTHAGTALEALQRPDAAQRAHQPPSTTSR